MKGSVCNKDCFSCKYEDCINDEMSVADYEQSCKLDAMLSEDPERSRVRMLGREYYRKNRARCIERSKAYAAAHREQIAERSRARYAENSELYREKARERYARNRADPAVQAGARRCREWRLEHGLSPKQMGELCGVTVWAIYRAESARTPLPKAVRKVIGGANFDEG